MFNQQSSQLHQTFHRLTRWLTRRFRIWLQLLLVSAISLIALPAQSYENAITIERVYDYQQDKKLLIDSESSFRLPENVIKAINSEVPMNFHIQLQLTEETSTLGFKYQRNRKTINFHTRLKAYGVNRIYSLYNTRNNKVQSFKSLDEALKTLSTLQAFPIASLSELHPEQRYTLRMRINLDIMMLPAPLMLEAIFTDNWLLDSQWYETTLTTPLSWQ